MSPDDRDRPAAQWLMGHDENAVAGREVNELPLGKEAETNFLSAPPLFSFLFLAILLGLRTGVSQPDSPPE
jgi:hypothetical protein